MAADALRHALARGRSPFSSRACAPGRLRRRVGRGGSGGRLGCGRPARPRSCADRATGAAVPTALGAAATACGRDLGGASRPSALRPPARWAGRRTVPRDGGRSAQASPSRGRGKRRGDPVRCHPVDMACRSAEPEHQPPQVGRQREEARRAGAARPTAPRRPAG